MSIETVGAYFDFKDVVSWTRDADGRRVERRNRADHACYLRSSDVKSDLATFLRTSSLVRSSREVEGGWTRVVFKSGDFLYRACAPKVRDARGPGLVPGLFPGLGIKTYEADLHPVSRWMLESDVSVLPPRRCYLDIEADSRVPLSRKEEARILSWTIGTDGGEYVTGVLAEESDSAEKDLLLDLAYELESYDQVVGWYSDDYDLPMIRARTEYQRISQREFEWRRWLWTDFLPIFRRSNISVSKSGDEKQSMALDAVARSLSKGRVGKLEGRSGASSYEMWRAGEIEPYNRHDTWLLEFVNSKTKYLELHLAICQLCGLLPDTRGNNPLRFVDSFILRLARKRGLRLPTMYGRVDDAERFEGAYVMKPTELGIIKDVHVCDFAGMYPSIIRSWNMSFETATDIVLEEQNRPTYLAHAPAERRPIPEGHCVSPNGVVFRNEPEGLLSIAVGEVSALRAQWTKKKASLPPETPEWIAADRLSTACKQMNNSFFGVAGCEFFRLYDQRVAESITLTGQWMIRQVIGEAEKRGMRGLYGDTDSAFVTGTTISDFQAFTEWCNKELFPSKLAEMRAPRSLLKLEYEKAYQVLVLLGKKRYAARWLHYKHQAPGPDSAPEVKGLEYKRGDTVRLARDLQARLLDLMLGGGIVQDPPERRATWCEDPDELSRLIAEWREFILEGELDLRDVSLSKKLTQGLDSYKQGKKKDGSDSAQPPHVAVGKLLRARGEHVVEGMKVEYFVADGTGSSLVCLPAADWAGDCDRYYLWDELVYPACQRILEACFPERDWKRFLASKDARAVGKALEKFSRWTTAAYAPLKGGIAGQMELFGRSETSVSSAAPYPWETGGTEPH